MAPVSSQSSGGWFKVRGQISITRSASRESITRSGVGTLENPNMAAVVFVKKENESKLSPQKKLSSPTKTRGTPSVTSCEVVPTAWGDHGLWA